MKNQKFTLNVVIISILIILAYMPTIPIGLVPITLQNIGVMLAGTLLGWRHSFLAIIVWLLLAIIGLPVLAGGTGGLPAFFSATAGYIWSYPFAALLIGLSVSTLDRFNKVNFVTILLTILFFGVLLIDFSGAIGLNMITNMPIKKALLLQLTFIPGDVVKAIATTVITLSLRRRFDMVHHA